MKKINTLLILCGSLLFSLTSCGETPLSEQINKYTVTWVVDGVETTETYTQGETPIYKFGTKKESDEVYSYTFSGWDKKVTAVTSDVTYTAVYSKEYIDYTYTWVIDGEVTTETYHYGDTPSYKGETPEKEASGMYAYEFTGWDKELNPVVSDLTLTAQFETVLNEYTITFIVGESSTTVSCYYGEIPSYVGTPTKESDAQYTYTFSGWDKEIVGATCDTTYTALFDKTDREYSVKWVVGNNSYVETYVYGETPIFKGSTDRDSAQYTYTFSGWDKEISEVTGDVTYVAQYSSVLKSYTINFYNEDGSELLYSEEFDYNENPVYNGDQTKLNKEGNIYYSYTFDGWKNGNEIYDSIIPAVTGVTNYYAHFSKETAKFDLKVNALSLSGSKLADSAIYSIAYQEVYKVAAPVVNGYAASQTYVGGILDDINNLEVNVYYSEIDTWDGTTVSSGLSGAGTETNPYLIQSGADLAYVRSMVNDGANTFANQYLKLTKSIDVSNSSNFRIGTSTNNSFAGYFDGNNCSITYNISSTTTRQALFYEVTATGTIANLTTYGSVAGGQYAGGVVGRLLGTVTNCKNFVNVTHSGGNGAGGITGGGIGLVDNCDNYGNIECLTKSSNNKTSGVMGAMESNSKVTNSNNYGNVIGGATMTGGIVGEQQNASILIENCANFGTVTADVRVGGIAGHAYKEVKNCTNYGIVQSTASTVSNNQSYVGGIVGVQMKSSVISYCTNAGTVSSYTKFVGGIVGATASGATVEINNCTNTGIVTSADNGVGGILGGSLDITTSVIISNCSNSGTVTGNTKVGGIVGALPIGTIDESTCTNTGLVTATGGSLSGDIIGSDERTA